MDLRQLTYLVTIADEGGFRPAARRLGVSQPSISGAVRSLELELGVTLLRRSSSGVELTVIGRELVDHGREILHRFQHAREAVQRLAEDTTGVLRVGLVSGIISAGELLAPIVATHRETHPDVALQLEEVSFADQVSPLLDERVDVMIVRGPVDRGPLVHHALAVEPIAEEPRVVLVAASHELAGQDRVDVEDVLDLPTLPLAAPSDWSSFWQLDELRGGALADDRITPAATVPEVQIAVALRGVIVTSPGSVARLQPNPLVRTLHLEGAPRAVIAVARRRRDRRRMVRDFVVTAQTAAAEHLHLMPAGVLPS